MLLCHSSNTHQSRRGRMKRHSDMSPFSDSGPKPSSSMLMAFKPTGCSQPNRTEQSSVVRLKDSKDEGGGWRPNRHWIALFIGTQRERGKNITSDETKRTVDIRQNMPDDTHQRTTRTSPPLRLQQHRQRQQQNVDESVHRRCFFSFAVGSFVGSL